MGSWLDGPCDVAPAPHDAVASTVRSPRLTDN